MNFFFSKIIKALFFIQINLEADLVLGRTYEQDFDISRDHHVYIKYRREIAASISRIATYFIFQGFPFWYVLPLVM